MYDGKIYIDLTLTMQEGPRYQIVKDDPYL